MEFDDYEMKEREQEREQEQEREAQEESEVANQDQQETNFDDIDDVTVNLVDVDLGGHSDWDIIPNVKKDVSSIKRSVTNDVKKYLETHSIFQ